MKESALPVSLVIPIRNEIESLPSLVESINRQTFAPREIILVDGGSADETVETAKELTRKDERFRVIEAVEATPGRGRNIGAAAAESEWIAFTDAGIQLEPTWLEKLVEAQEKNPNLDVVYGSFEPEERNFFERAAALAYAIPKIKIEGEWWRGPFIASSLMRREVWEKVGGFPDLRAAEDLIFMREVERQNFKIGYAPRAVVWWRLRPTVLSTFQKFVLYSKHNVWAKYQRYWHYGVARLYLLLLPFVLLACFHSLWWLLALPLWLAARTAKNILARRADRSLWWTVNPFQFVFVAFLILLIDAATFVGWAQALIFTQPQKSSANPFNLTNES